MVSSQEAELHGAAVMTGNGSNSNYAGGQEAAQQLFFRCGQAGCCVLCE